MEGGHKGKEKEEGKGRRERRRADDGKWPPPRCHMGGGLKELVLCCSYRKPRERKPILPFVSSLSHLLFSLFLPFTINVIFPSFSNFLTFHFSLSHEILNMEPFSSTHTHTHTGLQGCQTSIKGSCGRRRVGGHFDFQVYLICCVHTSLLAGGPLCGQVI